MQNFPCDYSPALSSLVRHRKMFHPASVPGFLLLSGDKKRPTTRKGDGHKVREPWHGRRQLQNWLTQRE
jgi:hypothetical protein